jgi:CheY-like chemotaxis protein
MDELDRFAGFKILVVEDETLIAMLVEDYLNELGFTVVEVAGTVARGMEVATAAGHPIDGAILDINLGTEKVFPIADALVDRGIPFVFATGYGPEGVLPRFAGCPVIAKPFRLDALAHFLASAFHA